MPVELLMGTTMFKKIRQVGMLSRRAASTTSMGTLDTPAITTMKL